MIASRVKELDPDIVNLHWVCNGFVQIETLPKLKKPIFWTLQDMWAFTGGCHYNQECKRFVEGCGRCPQLSSNQPHDLSYQIWKRKLKAWQDINLTVITPSAWMAECVKTSSLFRDRRVETIPFGLDTTVYRPIKPTVARRLLHLPLDKRLILFGALAATSDRRKGFHLLLPALKKLSQQNCGKDVELIVFGANEPVNPIDMGFKINYLGSFTDDIALALVYSAADVMIVPSLQESFGQTASEALACGTPVVAFDATGLKDIVDHKVNGYLARPYEAEDLSQGIAWILENRERYQKLAVEARNKAMESFTLELQAKRYKNLFAEVLKTY
jgi:glycosyltransferase involved in cell wall biosynthesis